MQLDRLRLAGSSLPPPVGFARSLNRSTYFGDLSPEAAHNSDRYKLVFCSGERIAHIAIKYAVIAHPGRNGSAWTFLAEHAISKSDTVSSPADCRTAQPHALFRASIFLCVSEVCSSRASVRPLSCISAFLYRCASQDGVLEREGNGWSPPDINHQCGSETRQAGATLVPNARIDNTGRTLF